MFGRVAPASLAAHSEYSFPALSIPVEPQNSAHTPCPATHPISLSSSFLSPPALENFTLSPSLGRKDGDRRERVRSGYKGCGVGRNSEKLSERVGENKGKEEKGAQVIPSPDGLINASYIPRPMQSIENAALRSTEPLPGGTWSPLDEKGRQHSAGTEEAGAVGTQTGAHTLLGTWGCCSEMT